jgi:hypothetical protein
MHRAARLLIAGLPTVLCAQPPQAASAADIVVSWTQIANHVRPEVRTSRSAKTIRLTLRDGGVTESRTVTDQRGRTKTRSGDSKFRDTMKLSNRVASSWSIEDANTLVRTESLPQHTEVVRVTKTSDSACTAQINYQLKPGYHEFQFRRIRSNVLNYATSVSAQDVTCRITAN